MEESQARLERIHAARTTPDREVAALVREATGERIARSERVLAGEVNEVHALRLASGADVVLRIDHLGIGFAHELWAMAAVRDAGVPVATVVACDPARFMLLERVPGRTLLELLLADRPDGARRRRLVEAAGEVLARLHGVSTTRHGPIGAGGEGAFPTLRAWLDEEFAPERYAESFALTGLSPALLERATDELARADAILGEPRLVHHDFGPKHLLVRDDDTISGLLDFGRVESADPVLDFSGWRYWYERDLPLDWLRCGYERIRPVGQRFEERLRVALLLELLHLLRHYAVAQPFPAAAAEGARALQELLG
jgi:aminoglycoside phosphotransferase (APT) family kinase protein